MSIHKVEVVRVIPEAHPNADALEVVHVYGFTCCVRKGDFKAGDLVAYIPPDSIVDSARPEFAFLKGHERIKVKRLRGIVSQGLVMRAPEGSKEGDDVMEQFGVKHYDPPEPMSTGGDNVKPPRVYAPKYDVENWRRYRHVLVGGEPIYVTEKIHGANGRWCCVDGQMFCGSHTGWKKEAPDNLWWKAAAQNPWIREFCEKNPEIVLYGEVFGQVQNLKYGAAKNQVFVRLFDVLKGNQWMDYEEIQKTFWELWDKYWVPVLAVVLYNEGMIETWAEGPSTIRNANNIREGVVLRPGRERTDPEIGRVLLKIVSNGYLEKG